MDFPNIDEARAERGRAISKTKEILENRDGSFNVPSQSVEEVAYLVRSIEGKFVCNCLDFKQRHMQIGQCKHIHAVRFWIDSQKEVLVEPEPTIPEDSLQCELCGSIRIVKQGISANQKQIFKCKDCSHKFREESLLKRARYTPELVSLTLDLYFSGLSLRKIARAVSSNFDVEIDSSTIHYWIQKYIPKISEYVNSLEPKLSETWHADELFLKMRNGISYNKDKRMAFLWNVMDRKTRFLLASKLSRFRDGDGATRAFREARSNSHGQEPEAILVDSLKSYVQGADYAFMDSKIQPKLIRNAGINKPHATNNRIERLNGTLRERVKVQRGWKSMGTPIAEGQRIHYNFVKPHEALDGQTPAQRAGIGKTDKWIDLLESSLRERT